MGFPHKLKACGKRTFMISLYGLCCVSNSVGFCLSTFDQFSHMARVCWSLHLVLGNCLLTLHRHHALNKIISGFHEKTGNELVTLWSSFWFFQKQSRVVIRVDWPITNRLPTTKHLFISSLYVLHFEWFKMLQEHYLKP